MARFYAELETSLKPPSVWVWVKGKMFKPVLPLVSGFYHHSSGPPSWIGRPSSETRLDRLASFFVFFDIMESDITETTNSTLSFDHCLICQKEKDERLVENPIAHEKVLSSIEEWSRYGNFSYVEAWGKLQPFSAEELQAKQASWHRSCYKDAAHTGMLKRAKERYERQLSGPNESRRKLREVAVESSQLTRSKTTPFNKEVCFFCDGQASQQRPLHNVKTFSAGESLRSAAGLAGNEKLSVKLNTAVAANDAHAIEIKYHLSCWLSNVTNALRKPESNEQARSKLASEIAAKIEFLTTTELALREGKIATMADLQEAYEKIREANNVADPTCSRKALKQLLQADISGIEFHKAKRVNESERVSIKTTRDEVIQLAEDQNSDRDDKMQTLFDAAALLRRSIKNSQKWEFTGSLESISNENVPMELFSFFRWIIQGPNDIFSCEKKSMEVQKRSMSLAQSTVSMCLTERQLKNKKSETVRSSSEMPQQLAVGLAVHQAVRSKKLINMLHGFGMSVEYNRVLRVEAQIESSVIKRMDENDGVYLPPDIVMGRHVFFAVDNVDFAEDTPDGRRTFHGTAMAIYQRTDPNDKMPDLKVEPITDQSRSITDLPESIVCLLECAEPTKKPIGPVYPQFGFFAEDEIPITVRKQDFAWLLSRTLTRPSTPSTGNTSTEEPPENQSAKITDIPVWSAYNSLTNDTLAGTRVGTPPLIAAPAHEWQTLLTVLMQAQDIKTKVIGLERKTVISLDLGLYQPAKKLQCTRQDLQHLILRPGELHIVMAQLRAIGAFIENSGLDMCWIESDLYGPATVKQILEGKHVKRGETAHIITLQALFMLYKEAVFKEDPTHCQSLEQLAKQLGDACADGTKERVKEAHDKLVQAIDSNGTVQKMEAFDAKQNKIPLFKFVRQYMRMIMEFMAFIRAVRTGDWTLHLEALELFTKYFFAHDMLNYARMIPVYLAEMKMLQESEPEIYEEFQQGNWVVNKNLHVPFCAIGADNALEHVNRSMKVSGGLVGITLNPNALAKYFLIAPELARLADQAKQMTGASYTSSMRHHNFTTAVRSRQEKNIEQLASCIMRFTNPFLEESNDLFNLVTKVVLPENVKEDLSKQSSIGSELFDKFVKDRIQTNKFSIWSPLKKRKLLTWKSTGKTVRVKADNKVIELKEDRSLFARMMMVCKSRPEINIKEAIGEYEFAVVPRSMFAADGTMLHCTSKSSLMGILEKLDDKRDGGTEQEVPAAQMKVSIVDAMAEVQALDKPEWVKSCFQLADHFTSHILEKYGRSDELRLIFDRFVTNLLWLPILMNVAVANNHIVDISDTMYPSP